VSTSHTGLVVDHLRAAYGKATVFEDVSFTLGRGEVIAIIGPNGTGKTTLLRALSGLVRDRFGLASLDGQDLLSLKPHQIARTGFAHVPEGRGTLSSLSVEENLRLGASSMRRAEVQTQLDSMYATFPVLKRLRHQMAGLLSGGEQQMMAVARGLMSRPKVLAIDEPSMGLAPVVIKDLVAMLHSATRTGVSVLLVEQNTALASQLAERVYVLANGRLSEHKSGEDPDLLSAFLA
jgi:branched-chain amino acid transport system ATP-binding protein